MDTIPEKAIIAMIGNYLDNFDLFNFILVSKRIHTSCSQLLKIRGLDYNNGLYVVRMKYR